MLPVAVTRSSSGGVTKSQLEEVIFEVFFPIDNSLYSIALATHTKTAELIEMPFALITRVGPRCHVLHWGPDPPRGGAIVGENVAAYCKVMGHSMVHCAKTAELIGRFG